MKDDTLNNILENGPHWLWPCLSKYDKGFQTGFEEVKVPYLESWEIFFAHLARGILQVPIDEAPFYEEEIELGVKPLLLTPVLQLLNNPEISIRKKVWHLRWGIDNDKRIYGSAFYSNPDNLSQALTMLDKAIPYSPNVVYDRAGPTQLMYDDDSEVTKTD